MAIFALVMWNNIKNDKVDKKLHKYLKTKYKRKK